MQVQILKNCKKKESVREMIYNSLIQTVNYKVLREQMQIDFKELDMRMLVTSL